MITLKHSKPFPVRLFPTFLLFLAVSVLVGGCETVREGWDETQEFYKSYVNVDPEVDLELDDYYGKEQKLAYLFMPVDMRLQSLLDYVGAKDTYPEDTWFMDLKRRYPWVSGALVVRMDGELLQQVPQTPLKPLEYSELLAKGEEFKDRQLRSHVDETPLGPEVYLATPFFFENELAGLIIVHFDFRSIAEFSPVPEDLIVFTPETPLWSGEYEAALPGILEKDWADMLEDDSYGEVRVDGGRYYWLSRFIGESRLVYAVDSST